MKLLRKLQPVPSSEFAVEPTADMLQLVTANDTKSKWSQHLHMPKLFKSNSSNQLDATAFTGANALRRRKRDAIKRTFFRKSSSTPELDGESDNTKPEADELELEADDRSSTETVVSWEEFNLADAELSAHSSDSDSDLGDGIKDGEFVFPPVVIPIGYRQQDRMGGVTVAGRRVLFTHAAFKRNSLKVSQLRCIPEEVSEEIVKCQPHTWPPSSALRRGYSRRGLYSSTDHNEWI